MPRIHAANIAEHVRQQEQAIVTAAAELFAEQGVANTDLGDIATAVGLARSSLYRYFPDKDHILLRWFELELEPVTARCEAIVASEGSAEDRLNRWLDYQLDYVTDPAHQLAPMIASEVGALDPEVRAAIGRGHARLYGTLTTLVEQDLKDQSRKAGSRRSTRDALVVTRLIGGLLEAAAQSITDGASVRKVRAELRHAATAVLAGP